MKSLRRLKEFLKQNPLVSVSLLIGVVEAPISFYSGVFLGGGSFLIGALLYSVSTLLWVGSTLIYFWILINKRE